MQNLNAYMVKNWRKTSSDLRMVGLAFWEKIIYTIDKHSEVAGLGADVRRRFNSEDFCFMHTCGSFLRLRLTCAICMKGLRVPRVSSIIR